MQGTRMTPMQFDNFVADCWMGGVQPLQQQVAVTALGLSGEAAEVMEKVLAAAATCLAAGSHAERIKKVTRGDEPKTGHRIEVGKELGDILFYVANQARLHDMTLEDVMFLNYEKLSGRLDRLGTLRGDGDNR